MKPLLAPGEKQVWDTPLDDHLMRTGSTSIWDAVLTPFAEYRNADDETRQNILKDKGISGTTPKSTVSDWISAFRTHLYDLHQNKFDTDYKLFFKLLSLRFLELELLTFLTESLPEDTTRQTFENEVREKTNMLAEYRLQKKAREFKLEDVQDSIDRVLDELLDATFLPVIPEEELQRLSDRIGYFVLCIDPEGEVLFDSKHDSEPGFSKETIVVCRFPTGFESIGRFSPTKDGHKRLSRLFPSDDVFLQKLREVDLNTENL